MGFFDRPQVIGPGAPDASDSSDGRRVRELEERVARLEAQVVAMQERLADGGTPADAVVVEEPWLTEVRSLKARGKAIHAIKLYRARTGVGLREAKEAVDAMPG